MLEFLCDENKRGFVDFSEYKTIPIINKEENIEIMEPMEDR
jgi:hypothetical protein